jgi:hypothetical protein
MSKINLFDIISYIWYIKIMDYALKERIGKPELFTGRKEELYYFLWYLIVLGVETTPLP